MQIITSFKILMKKELGLTKTKMDKNKITKNILFLYIVQKINNIYNCPGKETTKFYTGQQKWGKRNYETESKLNIDESCRSIPRNKEKNG